MLGYLILLFIIIIILLAYFIDYLNTNMKRKSTTQSKIEDISYDIYNIFKPMD